MIHHGFNCIISKYILQPLQWSVKHSQLCHHGDPEFFLAYNCDLDLDNMLKIV